MLLWLYLLLLQITQARQNQLRVPEGWKYISTDASWAANNCCIAGMALDHTSRLIQWLQKCRNVSPLQAEAKAILLAARVAIGQGWKHIRLFCDSLLVVQVLKVALDTPYSIKDIILETR